MFNHTTDNHRTFQMVPREDIKGNCRTIVAAARGRPVPSPGVDEFPRRLYAVRVLSGSCTTL